MQSPITDPRRAYNAGRDTIGATRRTLSEWRYRSAFRMKYGFWPPPTGTDLVGYDALIRFMRSRKITRLPGDVLEIGVFCGGGTYTLAKFLKSAAPQKKVLAVDVFDVSFDATMNTAGNEMREIYRRALGGRTQREVFRHVTQGLDNVVVFEADSRQVELAGEAACFGFIDGNHSSEYVVNDFYLTWRRLVPGGAVAFHDYGHDLPNVTETIDRLRERHSSEIVEFSVDSERHIAFITKGNG